MTTMTRDNQTLIGLYRLMAMTRVLDGVIGKEDGHWHGLRGEEGVVAGVYYGLRREDIVAPHYRGLVNAAYAKGGDLRRLLAGVIGKATSYSRGRHRSDICGPEELGIIGLYTGALGPALTYAAGSALSFKLDGNDNVAVAVFGDGTSSRGDCHEAMNMASALSLPIVFVCQNNQIAISTPWRSGVSAAAVADRAKAYNFPGITVDGNDVLAVHDAVSEAVARARRGEGPSLIEALTYRVTGHFVADAIPYDDQEAEKWRARDPVETYRRYLIDEGVAGAAELDAIESEVEAEADEAMTQAKQDPAPGPDVLAGGIAYA
jgi:TPP-dependent pyruvate/acetoin dehydrogenase alpha subunit